MKTKGSHISEGLLANFCEAKIFVFESFRNALSITHFCEAKIYVSKSLHNIFKNHKKPRLQAITPGSPLRVNENCFKTIILFKKIKKIFLK
jgi:hypothetical protein